MVKSHISSFLPRPVQLLIVLSWTGFSLIGRKETSRGAASMNVVQIKPLQHPGAFLNDSKGGPLAILAEV
jgi:hypothetical protein